MGKPKYIETPEALYELFLKYKDEVKDNPRLKHVFVGKDGVSEYERLERPLTMEGFQAFGWRNNKTIDHYFSNLNDSYKEYCSICSRIKQEIRQDQIEGGMVGQYNPSITQRLNGLTDKSEVTVKEQPLFGEDEK